MKNTGRKGKRKIVDEIDQNKDDTDDDETTKEKKDDSHNNDNVNVNVNVHTDADNAGAAREVDFTQLFEGNIVRNQLYRQESELPRFSTKNAELVGTSAALLLRNLVQRTIVHADANSAAQAQKPMAVNESIDTKTNDTNSKKWIKASDVQRIIQDDPTYASFFNEPLMGTSKNERLVEYKIQQGNAAKAAARKAKKTMTEAIGDNSSSNKDPSTSYAVLESVVPDDDDYD